MGFDTLQIFVFTTTSFDFGKYLRANFSTRAPFSGFAKSGMVVFKYLACGFLSQYW